MKKRDVLREMRQLAKVVGAPGSSLPTIEASPAWDGHPSIQFEGPFALYVISERGVVYSSRRFSVLDDLLYQVFEDVTFSMAGHREIAQRREDEDFRRQLFQIQADLMGRLSPAWESRLRRKIEAILVESPYSDDPRRPP